MDHMVGTLVVLVALGKAFLSLLVLPKFVDPALLDSR